jgi:hypothetical protein
MFLRYVSVIAAIRSAIRALSKADSPTASYPAPVGVRPEAKIYLLMGNCPPLLEREINGQAYGNGGLVNDQ